MLYDSATKIQRLFRSYILRKKTRAALKIQRFYRQCLSTRKQIKAILEGCKRMVCAYKIYYFLGKKCLPHKFGQPSPQKKAKIEQKTATYKISKKIISISQKYLIMMSAFIS